MSESNLAVVISKFVDERIEDIREINSGHINRSYLVNGSTTYVLQCMDNALYGKRTDVLENNYLLYREACLKAKEEIGEWYCPEWIKDNGGHFFHTDSEGQIWRMYRFIEGDDPDTPSLSDASLTGQGLGKLHRILGKCDPARFGAVIPHLHDFGYYYDEYLKQAETHIPREKDIEQAISNNIENMLAICVPGGCVIHGDAKRDNMIFRDGEVVGFVDLDTMMSGSIFDDLADLMRSCCIDSENGGFDEVKMRQIIRGYEAGADVSITQDSVELIEKNTAKNRFMLGLRYYTDYLSGSTYFIEKYSGQNLEKARRLLIH